MKKLTLLFLFLLIACQDKASVPYYVTPDWHPHWTQPETQHLFPSIKFQNQLGDSLTQKNLLGKITVYSFFFTHCPHMCPMTVQNLKGVAEDFKTNPKVQLASISIAPQSDSAKALAEFGEKQGLLNSKWNLLRGSAESIKELALKYFFSPVMMEGEGPEPLHSERAYLVDPLGNLRGTYHTSKPSDMKRLLVDIKKLLLETE